MQFYYEQGTNKQFRSIKEIDKQFRSIKRRKKIQSITPQARQENDRQKLGHVSEPAKSNLYFRFYLICCLIFFYSARMHDSRSIIPKKRSIANKRRIHY